MTSSSQSQPDGNDSGGAGSGHASSSHPRRRILGGRKHRHASSAAAAPIREDYEKMWKGTAVMDHRRGEGEGADGKEGAGEGGCGGGLEDSFVRGLWGSAGAPTGLSTLDIDADADGGAAEGGDYNGDAPAALATLVWKRRAGLGGKLAVAARKEWEQRRLELVGTALRYYCIEMDGEEEESSAMVSSAEDESEEADPSENGTSALPPAPPPSTSSSTRSAPLTPSSRKKPPTSSPSWRAHVSFGGNSQHDPSTPRGTLDLSREEFAVEVFVEDTDDSKAHLPTPYVLRVLRHGDLHWKICLDSQDALDEWAEALQSAMGEERVEFSNNGSEQYHGFQPGDHVIRWEVMVIPVAYPIQIHGIVLEAGKNCVIIADFGLTSYGKKEKEGESDMAYDVSTSNEDKEHHSVVMDHWKKLRPNQLQRLNVIAYTDEKEIRKWKKVNYGEAGDSTPKTGRKKKLGQKMSSLFRKKSGGEVDTVSKTRRTALSDPKSVASMTSLQEGTQIDDRIPDTEEEGSFTGVSQKKESNGAANGSIQMSDTAKDVQASVSEKNTPANEPAWFGGQDSETSKPGVFALETPETEEESSTENKSDKDTPKLPKSDPAKIVLARTNFLLEHGDDVLPPYHVFQSNSECIAVWCKTGRWSTLQATIFLGSCLVGNTKTATVMTMGVAAAHAILLPVAAVGGIAAATAPWIILKKSKEKWEQITISLTEKFWAWAPPEVYVEAIQHWSDL